MIKKILLFIYRRFTFKHQTSEPYICVPFSILEEKPEYLKAFRRCGCEPGKSEVGIVLKEDIYGKEE